MDKQEVIEAFERFYNNNVSADPALNDVNQRDAETIRAYLTDPGYVRVPVNNVTSVKRIGDQSLEIEFPSCRSASEFEAMLTASQGEG